MGTPTTLRSERSLADNESAPKLPGAGVGDGTTTDWLGAASERVTCSSVKTMPNVNAPALTMTRAARYGGTSQLASYSALMRAPFTSK
jgi:hypothetical protein